MLVYLPRYVCLPVFLLDLHVQLSVPPPLSPLLYLYLPSLLPTIFLPPFCFSGSPLPSFSNSYHWLPHSNLSLPPNYLRLSPSESFSLSFLFSLSLSQTISLPSHSFCLSLSSFHSLYLSFSSFHSMFLKKAMLSHLIYSNDLLHKPFNIPCTSTHHPSSPYRHLLDDTDNYNLDGNTVYQHGCPYI